MAVVFAVFLVALLAVFLKPEGRADRFARTAELFRSGAATGRAWFSRGSEAVDRLSADLAADDSSSGGLDGLLGDGLLGPVEPAPVAPTAE